MSEETRREFIRLVEYAATTLAQPTELQGDWCFWKLEVALDARTRVFVMHSVRESTKSTTVLVESNDEQHVIVTFAARGELWVDESYNQRLMDKLQAMLLLDLIARV
ncbi:MAG: hypothetical protein AB7L09_01750 [Nitrospira sp.]